MNKSIAIEDNPKQENVSSFSASDNNAEVLDGSWEVTIPIDKSKFSRMEKIYKIGQSVEVEGQIYFQAELKKDLEDIDNNFSISNEATDANGNDIEIIVSGGSDTENKCYINYSLKLKDNFKGPIRFKINDYPSKIKGAFKVKIPLGN